MSGFFGKIPESAERPEPIQPESTTHVPGSKPKPLVIIDGCIKQVEDDSTLPEVKLYSLRIINGIVTQVPYNFDPKTGEII